MMKIGYIEKPRNYGEDDEYTNDPLFLTEEQYDVKDRWEQHRYQRIVYQK